MNDVDLQGLSHATTVDILQNAPDDVTLVVSQPKERLYKGESSVTSVSTCKTFLVITYRAYRLRPLCFCPVLTESSSGYAPFQAKSALKALDSGQKQDLDYDNSSEEQMRGSPSPPLHSTGTPSSSSSPVYQQTSLTSQASRGGVAKTSPPPSNGVLQCLERAKAGTTAASVAQHHKPAPTVGLDPLPPALPPKTRKAKVSEAPKVVEHSDRGDSDMDEETFSSKQEKLKVKKVRALRFEFFYGNTFFVILCTQVIIGQQLKISW